MERIKGRENRVVCQKYGSGDRERKEGKENKIGEMENRCF